jgi:hypothetical protein
MRFASHLLMLGVICLPFLAGCGGSATTPVADDAAPPDVTKITPGTLKGPPPLPLKKGD